MTRLRAVWPVVDESLIPTPEVLVAEALADLPNVARRSRCEIAGPAQAAVLEGRLVPGSGGARWVVLAQCDAVPIPARGYTARLLPQHARRTA